MPPERHFGIIYDMDFFFCSSFALASIYYLSLPSVQCSSTVEWAFYLWQYLTQSELVS